MIYKHISSLSDQKAYEQFHWPLTIRYEIANREREIERKDRVKFVEQLIEEKQGFEEELEKIQAQIRHIVEDLDDFSQASDYDKLITGVHEALQNGKTRMEDFNKRERLCGVEPTEEASMLEDYIYDFKKYHTLWTVAIEFSHAKDEWQNGIFINLPAGQIKENLTAWRKSMEPVTKWFVRHQVQCRVCEDIISALDEFELFNPIFENCRHPSFESRHWMSLFDAIGVDVEEFVDLQFSLTHLIDAKIMDNLDVLAGIATEARQEYDIRRR